MNAPKRVEYVDSALARQVDEHVWIGSMFVLADAGGFGQDGRQGMEHAHGPGPHGRYCLPLGWSAPVELPGMLVRPASLPGLELRCVTSDKAIYRAARDAVHLLAVDLLRPGVARDVVVRTGSADFSRRPVRLDASGMAAVTVVDLPPGDYQAAWGDAAADEPACEFTVAEYLLSPLVATLVRRTMQHDPPRLAVMLHLETFGVPVQGRVRLQLVDRGEPVATAVVEARQGAAYGSFALEGEGPHAIYVQMIDAPSRTATVPLYGSRREERKHTVLSRLGPVVTASLLPGQESREVRGLFLDEEGVETSPIHLERVDTPVVRLRAAGPVQAVCAQVVDLSVRDRAGATRLAVVDRAEMGPGDVIEIESHAPLGLVAVACFVEGKPWEGMAAVVAPSRVKPRVCVPERAAPGEEVTIQVDVGGDEASVYLVVKDARLPAPDTPATRLAGAIKRGAERLLGRVREPRGPLACRSAYLAEWLLVQGIISREQLDEAEELAARLRTTVIDALVRSGYAMDEEAARAVAAQYGCQYVDLGATELPTSVVELVPESVARENVVLPLAEEERELTVAMSSPGDYETLDKLQFILNRRIRPVVASRAAIREAINRHYGETIGESVGSMLQEFTDTAIDFTETEDAIACLHRTANDGPERYDLSAWVREKPIATAPPPPRPADEAEVVFAGLLPVAGGRAAATVRLASGMTEYTAEALVVARPDAVPDWAAAEARFQARKDPYAELQLPRFVHAGDGAEGRLHAGASSGRFGARVSRDGADVPLRLDDGHVSPDEVLELGRCELTFLATAGDYEATVEDVVTGAVDRVAGRVELPGRLRRAARPLRLLEPGDRIGRDDEPDIIALGVLPGLERPFHALVEATGGYEFCCCEQTAAKVLAAAAMYATSADPTRRAKAEEILLAGVRRESKMWLRGRGFKAYPDVPDTPDNYVGPLAARHLHYVDLVSDLDGMSDQLRRAVADAVRMARDAAAAYRLDWPPPRPITAHDAYAAVRFGADAASRRAAVELARNRLAHEADPGGQSNGHLGRKVALRADTAYAAATLLRGGDRGDLRAALAGANRVVHDLGPEARLYSTVDSVAAIALLAELRAARIVGSNATVRVNGCDMPAGEAAAMTGTIQSVEAVGTYAAVEVTRWVEEDWGRFSAAVPLRVALMHDTLCKTRFGLAETFDLCVTLLDGYRMGDLLWVCLPASLSRLAGGAQVKQFAVDFEGRDTVRVPLVTTGPSLNVQGQPGPHHFAVAVRNMFDEERTGNPGMLEVTVAAASPSA